MSRSRLRPILRAQVENRGDGKIVVSSPAVGLWRGAPPLGRYLGDGATIGQLEVLGVLHDVLTAHSATGFVIRTAEGDARVPVGYGDELVVLDPSQVQVDDTVSTTAAGDQSDISLPGRKPSSCSARTSPSAVRRAASRNTTSGLKRYPSMIPRSA